MDKKEIRSLIRKLTAEQPATDKDQQAAIVTERLCDRISQLTPRTVAAFMPLGDEIAIDITKLSEQCRIVIPRITQSTDSQAEMEFYDYDATTTASGSYGIDEPQGNDAISADQIDIMILPGVAFSCNGDRLGRGKGFYDRYTSREGFRAYSIGVCFRHQIFDNIPTEPHDRPVDELITAE